MIRLNQSKIYRFLVDTNESNTFGELLDKSIRVAISLKKLKLGDNDVIAISSLNNKNVCVPYLAGLFNGNIVTFLDPFGNPKEKAIMLRKVTPSVLFVDEDNLENIEETLKIAGLNIRIVLFSESSREYISFDKFLEASEEEIKAFEPVKLETNERTALIVFSSGTTGVPKGICLSHAAILIKSSGYSPPVSLIFTTPNWISYPLLLITSIRAGNARVLCKKYDMSQIWSLIAKYKVNMIITTVYQLCQMIKHPIEKDTDLSSLFFIMISGATLPLEIISRIKKMIPNLLIIQGYGLTEVCGLSLVFDLAQPEEQEWHKKKPVSCGTPIKGIWYKVVDPDTELILGPNKPGELRLKSNCMMLGYFNEDSSKDFDADGYFKTGDIVQYDEDKCFYIMDRIKELLKYQGNVVSPTALEDVLTSHPTVEIAAVIGIPHVEDGDHPMGVVKLRSNCTVNPGDLMQYVDEIIEDKTRRLWAGIKIVEDIPVNGVGKINKRKLRDMILTGKI